MRRSLQFLHRSFPTLPHYSRLRALVGERAAANETGWMMEHIVGQHRYDAFRRGRAGKAGDTPSRMQAEDEPSVSSFLSAAEMHWLSSMMHSRAVLRQPLQYLLGSVSFLGLPLLTRAPILIPRPETECMIGWTLTRWAQRDYSQRYAHMQIQRETNLSDLSGWVKQANQTRQHQTAKGTQETVEHAAADDDAVAASSSPPLRVLDLCCGSGNIALSLAHHFPSATRRSAHVVGVDVNPAAITLAHDNLAEMNKLGLCLPRADGQLQRACSFAQVDLMQKQQRDEANETNVIKRMRAQRAAQDTLIDVLADPPAAVAELIRLSAAPCPLSSRSLLPLASPGGPYDLVVSNPPYIPFREYLGLQSEVREWEDYCALVSGEEGMDLFDQILRMLPSLMTARPALVGGAVPEVVMELGSASQAIALADRLQSLGFDLVTIHHDLADLPRWIAAARTSNNTKR